MCMFVTGSYQRQTDFNQRETDYYGYHNYITYPQHVYATA